MLKCDYTRQTVNSQILITDDTHPNTVGSDSTGFLSPLHCSETRCFSAVGWCKHGSERVCPDHKSQSSRTKLTMESSHRPLETQSIFPPDAFIYTISYRLVFFLTYYDMRKLPVISRNVPECGNVQQGWKLFQGTTGAVEPTLCYHNKLYCVYS